MAKPFTLQSKISSVLIVLAISPATFGQQTAPSSQSAVKPTAFAAESAGKNAQTVKFGRRVAQVGDAVEQTLSLEMQLKTALRQGNELRDQKNTSAQTQQKRIVTTTEVSSDRAMAVTVKYVAATKRTTGTLEEATENSAGEPQAVQGKTFHCRREPGEDGKLIVTDEAGNIPSLEEYEIVANGMDYVGRPNPLVDFLAGQAIKLGQTITLPNEMAAQLFNLGDAFGEVAKFELTLQEVRNVNGADCAAFRAKVTAGSHGGSPMRMEIEGPFAVEIATCRAADVDFSGPISMTETRGTYSTAYHMLATGRLSMGIASTYRDAKR